MNDEECTDPEAPFCGVTGECGTCEGTEDPDGACAGVDPLLPLCAGGSCVACTPENPAVCDMQLLLCDGDSNACVPCTEHAQCGSGACELAVGTCFPEDVVVTVDGDGPADYATLAAAVAAVDDGGHGVIVVHELDGAGSYQTAGMGLRIEAGKTIALLAATGEAPVIQGTGGNPGLTVSGAGTILYMEGMTVSGNTMGLGLLVDGAVAWVDRSRIVQNTGGGVRAENGAELTLRNCFVTGPSDGDAIVVNASDLRMVYTTAGAGLALDASTALTCDSTGSAEVRNSILISADDDPEVLCDLATLMNSATESQVGFDANWFDDYLNGDFSLSPSGTSAFAGIAVWQAGDPLTDIDGDPRPTIDGTPDYAGADVPQ